MEVLKGIFIAIAVIWILFLIGLAGWSINNESWKKEAINRGHAEHHPKTGEWQWKDCRDKK